jgi:hypothetical protein
VNSPGVPEPPPRPALVRPRLAVAFWAAAILAYALLGAFFQPFFLLGFWESIPYLLLVTWIAGRLFPRPVPPLPPRDGR